MPIPNFLRTNPLIRKVGSTMLVLCTASGTIAETRKANFTGPLVTPNASAIPSAMAVIEPYLIYTESHALYDDQGNRHANHPGSHQWLLLMPATIGITDRLNGRLIAGSAYNVSGRYHSDGARMTDTSATLQYMFVAPNADGTGPAVSASYTHVFPTGYYDHLGDNPLNGTGTGSSTNRLSVFAQQLFWLANDHPLRLRALLAWAPSPSRVAINGKSTHGTPVHFHGSTKLGASRGATTSLEYGLDRHWVLAADLTWDHQGGTRVDGQQCLPTEACRSLAQHHPPRWNYSVAPAVEYNFNSSIGLIVGAQISIAGHNSPADYAPQAALSMAF
ncbi:hypothetical protein [Dyella sp. Tek66A03]|uniref:hypothetical protein n=1 Tax=Dyella sp. Tek66A03 TaxID=3458298 RepID=UPI00403E5D34